MLFLCHSGTVKFMVASPAPEHEESRLRITLLPSAAGSDPALQFLTTLLVNDTVAIDAGCLGLSGTLQEQARVRYVFLSHTHMDHLASLPIFLNNTAGPDSGCVHVYGSQTVLDCLRCDVFNDRIWPDFIRISAQGRSYLELHPLTPGVAVRLEGLAITPVPVDHAVPTTGFLIQDAHCSVIFSADTGPTEEIWKVANGVPNLAAVFLEVTYPDALAWLAELSRHLTPAQFGAEARKVKRAVPFIAVHIHPRTREQVVRELLALDLPDVRVGQFGVPYQF
jgi:ribonuclease BN (tRNA processing enzyme)